MCLYNSLSSSHSPSHPPSYVLLPSPHRARTLSSSLIPYCPYLPPHCWRSKRHVFPPPLARSMQSWALCLAHLATPGLLAPPDKMDSTSLTTRRLPRPRVSTLETFPVDPNATSTNVISFQLDGFTGIGKQLGGYHTVRPRAGDREAALSFLFAWNPCPPGSPRRFSSPNEVTEGKASQPCNTKICNPTGGRQAFCPWHVALTSSYK
jgi:hypothetical protein